ncbi:MAG TPA: hypothetical protein VF827_08640, partial [Syntrophales bacterium]
GISRKAKKITAVVRVFSMVCSSLRTAAIAGNGITTFPIPLIHLIRTFVNFFEMNFLRGHSDFISSPLLEL